ncbi:MAG: polyprenyl synthetase family protein, partial [Sinomonas sp.]|nr:polyprenyl synthetase family protein [Sinomonas sp.]
MTNTEHSWTSAGHGHSEGEPAPTTTAIAAGIQLPAGFAAIAGDPEIGPAIMTSMARVEKRLREAIANSDPLADA